jgi:hypothetical protein
MMKTFILSAAMVLMIAHPAFAKPMVLKGAAADAFIAKHFPDAEIPGDVSGKFTYVHDHRNIVGRAKCSVPAMGARSDGAVSECTVWC